MFTPETIPNCAFGFEPSRTNGSFKDSGKTRPCNANGDTVAVLTDFSGNGFDAVAPTSGNNGTYQLATAFSAPSVSLDGTASYFSFGAPAALEGLKYTGFTFTTAVNVASSGGYNDLLTKFDSNNYESSRIFFCFHGDAFIRFEDVVSSSVNILAGGGLNSNNGQIITGTAR